MPGDAVTVTAVIRAGPTIGLLLECAKLNNSPSVARHRVFRVELKRRLGVFIQSVMGVFLEGYAPVGGWIG